MKVSCAALSVINVRLAGYACCSADFGVPDPRQMERSLMPRLLQRLLVVVLLFAAAATLSAASLEGTVVNDLAAPIEGASVSLMRADQEEPTVSQSDAGGRYRFADLVEGRYTVTVELAGFQTQEIFHWVEAEEFLDVALSVAQLGGGFRLHEVVGRIEAPSPEGARVVALRPISNRVVATIQAKADGTFRLQLEDGQYLVYGYKPCHVGDVTTLILWGDTEPRPVELRLEPLDLATVPFESECSSNRRSDAYTTRGERE